MSHRPALQLIVNNKPHQPQPTPGQGALTPADLGEQMREFEKYLLVHRGLKASTIENYTKLVRRALRECGTLNPSADTVEDAVVALHNRGMSYNHIINTSLAIERYTAFIGKPIKLGRPRKPKTAVKNTLTEAEVAVIMAACKNTRERAMIGLLAYSGIRNDELCRLKKKDLDIASNLLTVREGKGSKDRIIPVSGDSIKLVLEYLAEWPRDNEDYLFTTLRTNKQYTGWALRQMVRSVTNRTEIKKHVHPHLFRHSLATNMLARGAGLITIQRQLGHNQIETTMRYLSPKNTRHRAEYQAYAPSYI